MHYVRIACVFVLVEETLAFLFSSEVLPGKGRGGSLFGTVGDVFDQKFLEKVSPFYNIDTGTELMGPLMYSLYRSTRPNICVEIGAGYTTFWLAKAAADAAKEAAVEIEADNSGTAPWTFWNSLVGRRAVAQATVAGTYSGEGRCAAFDASRSSLQTPNPLC